MSDEAAKPARRKKPRTVTAERDGEHVLVLAPRGANRLTLLEAQRLFFCLGRAMREAEGAPAQPAEPNRAT